MEIESVVRHAAEAHRHFCGDEAWSSCGSSGSGGSSISSSASGGSTSSGTGCDRHDRGGFSAIAPVVAPVVAAVVPVTHQTLAGDVRMAAQCEAAGVPLPLVRSQPRPVAAYTRIRPSYLGAYVPR